NLSEKRTYDVLEKASMPHDAQIFAKIRVADVINIEKSGISNDLYRFSLQSHFDFVVADAKYDPQFAVEFDGPHHQTDEQRSRDLKKDNLCKRFELPLLRVNDDSL